MTQGKAEREGQHGRQGGSLLERTSAAMGLIVTVAMLGFIGWRAGTDDAEEPPRLTVEVAQVGRSGGHYVVEFVARNASSAAVADLHVEGVLRQGEAEVERSDAALDYAPGRSERRGGLFFTHDPARYTLEIRPTGYQEP